MEVDYKPIKSEYTDYLDGVNYDEKRRSKNDGI